MVVDFQAERELRKLHKRCNPSPARDTLETAFAYFVVAAAICVMAWVIVVYSPPRG